MKMMAFTFAELPNTVPMVWEGCVVKPHEATDAAEALKSMLGLQHPVHVMGCTETLPDYPGDTASGGRVDLFFAIADEDVPRAAIRRLRAGDMRWAMDANPDLYAGPARRVVMSTK